VLGRQWCPIVGIGNGCGENGNILVLRGGRAEDGDSRCDPPTCTSASRTTCQDVIGCFQIPRRQCAHQTCQNTIDPMPDIVALFAMFRIYLSHAVCWDCLPLVDGIRILSITAGWYADEPCKRDAEGAGRAIADASGDLLHATIPAA